MNLFAYNIHFAQVLKKVTLITLLCWVLVSLPLSGFSWAASETLLKGNEYLQKGNYQQAITAYQETIKLNPYHKIAYCNLGKCYQKLNLFDKAEKCLKRALELDPDYIEALNNSGSLYVSQGKDKEAWKCYNRILEINPIDAEAHYNLASLFQKKHDFERAISHGKQAIKINPNYVAAFIKLGDIYWESYRDADKASIYYKKAKDVEPGNKLVRSHVAEMYLQKGLIKDAERECLEIVSIDPLFLPALNQLIKIYTDQGMSERIGPLCQKISSTTTSDNEIPAYSSVLSSMIALLIDHGMDKNAATLSQKLTSLTPSSKTFDAYLSTLTNLITLAFDKKRYEKAVPFCKRITTLVPSNKALNSYRDTLNRLIRLYFNHKRYKDSIPLCQRLTVISPLDKIVHYQLSIAYKGMGDYKGCVNAATKACQKDSEDEMCWHIMEKGVLELDRQRVGTPLRNDCSKKHLEMAQQYLGLGNTILAEYEYKKAKRLNPQSVPVRLELAKYYEGQGLNLESIEESKKIIELDPENVEAKDRIEMGWKQKTTSSPLPDLRKRRVAVIFSAKNPIHLEIDKIAEEIIEELLGSSFTILPIAAKNIQTKMNNTGLNTVNNLQEAVGLARSIQASYLLFGEIQEEKGRICIESQLINLKAEKLKKEQEFLHIGRNSASLTKCLSGLSQNLSNFFPIHGEIISSSRTSVTINLGEKHGVKPSFICDALDPDGHKIAEIEIISVSNSTSQGIITTASGRNQLSPHNRVSLRKGQVVKVEKKKGGKKEEKKK
ncbi:MAG: tetratricopeptide repeat protein [Candidatus Desantisbacteria bacterium]